MDEIERRARQIYADHFPGDCGHETREWIMEGKHGNAETIQAIICALSIPNGWVLMPRVLTEEMLQAGYPAEDAQVGYEAMIDARPEIPND